MTLNILSCWCFRLEAARIHQYILAGAAVVAVVTWVVEELGLIIEVSHLINSLSSHFVKYTGNPKISKSIFLERFLNPRKFSIFFCKG